MFKRLKNIWALSGADVVKTEDGTIIVEDNRKPAKRPAIILEDAPIDLFPDEKETL